ncbi:defective transmitter release [Haematobia irritans]|uniref:defective transmitter release n=1 Tax=Haematobia irritans TaxID=7368 RepID=UPI003F4FBB9A
MATTKKSCTEPKEIGGLNRITKKRILELCKKDKLYQTPSLNDVLYLHYQGFQCIESLEDYTELKCLWLECNAISEIQGLENQTKLKCLYLQSNLIKKIENLGFCKELDTINLSQNHIRKIENLGCDILPVLNTLNISSNYIKDSDGLKELENCTNLSVLDLSNNRIDDILVVKIFAKMPELKVLVLQGNPVVSKIPQYRKTLILECKKLTYLDSRPVFPKDRACAEAWKRGGYEEERKENDRWNRKERRKMRDSVNATIRMRNKFRKPEDQLTLLVSSDSEDESKKIKRRRQQEELDAGVDMELGIWEEVAGDDNKSETTSSSDMNVSSSTSVLSSSSTDSTAECFSVTSKTDVDPQVKNETVNNVRDDKDPEIETMAESINMGDILKLVNNKKIGNNEESAKEVWRDKEENGTNPKSVVAEGIKRGVEPIEGDEDSEEIEPGNPDNNVSDSHKDIGQAISSLPQDSEAINSLSHDSDLISPRRVYLQIEVDNGNYEPLEVMEKAMESITNTEIGARDRIKEGITSEGVTNALEYKNEYNSVNDQIVKDFENMSSNMDIHLNQLQKDQNERKDVIEALFTQSQEEPPKEMSTSSSDEIDNLYEEERRFERLVDHWDGITKMKGNNPVKESQPISDIIKSSEKKFHKSLTDSVESSAVKSTLKSSLIDDDFVYEPLDITCLTRASNQALDSFERETNELRNILNKLEQENNELYKDSSSESQIEVSVEDLNAKELQNLLTKLEKENIELYQDIITKSSSEMEQSELSNIQKLKQYLMKLENENNDLLKELLDKYKKDENFSDIKRVKKDMDFPKQREIDPRMGLGGDNSREINSLNKCADQERKKHATNENDITENHGVLEIIEGKENILHTMESNSGDNSRELNPPYKCADKERENENDITDNHGVLESIEGKENILHTMESNGDDNSREPNSLYKCADKKSANLVTNENDITEKPGILERIKGKENILHAMETINKNPKESNSERKEPSIGANEKEYFGEHAVSHQNSTKQCNIEEICAETVEDIIETLPLKSSLNVSLPIESDNDDIDSPDLNKDTNNIQMPLAGTIRGVIESLTDIFKKPIQQTTKRTPKICITQEEKSSCLKNLLQHRDLDNFNKDTHESLDNLLAEYKAEESKDLRDLVDRVYAQKDLYDDNIEFIEGKLMVVDKSTGLVKRELSTQTYDSDRDYETAESADEGACCSKPRKVKRRTPQNIPDLHKIPNECESDNDDEFYSLEPQPKPNLYENIDKQFIDHLSMEHLNDSLDLDSLHQREQQNLPKDENGLLKSMLEISDLPEKKRDHIENHLPIEEERLLKKMIEKTKGKERIKSEAEKSLALNNQTKEKSFNNSFYWSQKPKEAITIYEYKTASKMKTASIQDGDGDFGSYKFIHNDLKGERGISEQTIDMKDMEENFNNIVAKNLDSGIVASISRLNSSERLSDEGSIKKEVSVETPGEPILQLEHENDEKTALDDRQELPHDLKNNDQSEELHKSLDEINELNLENMDMLSKEKNSEDLYKNVVDEIPGDLCKDYCENNKINNNETTESDIVSKNKDYSDSQNSKTKIVNNSQNLLENPKELYATNKSPDNISNDSDSQNSKTKIVNNSQNLLENPKVLYATNKSPNNISNDSNEKQDFVEEKLFVPIVTKNEDFSDSQNSKTKIVNNSQNLFENPKELYVTNESPDNISNNSNEKQDFVEQKLFVPIDEIKNIQEFCTQYGTNIDDNLLENPKELYVTNKNLDISKESNSSCNEKQDFVEQKLFVPLNETRNCQEYCTQYGKISITGNIDQGHGYANTYELEEKQMKIQNKEIEGKRFNLKEDIKEISQIPNCSMDNLPKSPIITEKSQDMNSIITTQIPQTDNDNQNTTEISNFNENMVSQNILENPIKFPCSIKPASELKFPHENFPHHLITIKSSNSNDNIEGKLNTNSFENSPLNTTSMANETTYSTFLDNSNNILTDSLTSTKLKTTHRNNSTPKSNSGNPKPILDKSSQEFHEIPIVHTEEEISQKFKENLKGISQIQALFNSQQNVSNSPLNLESFEISTNEIPNPLMEESNILECNLEILDCNDDVIDTITVNAEVHYEF